MYIVCEQLKIMLKKIYILCGFKNKTFFVYVLFRFLRDFIYFFMIVNDLNKKKKNNNKLVAIITTYYIILH